MPAPAFEEIVPRELKPALLELDGISRESVEAHYKLYEGYVNKRNEILRELGEVDLGAANQVYSRLRVLKVELTFAVGGIKNHELYFEHLGGAGGNPDGAFGQLVERDFGSADEWRADLKATGTRRARLGVDRVRLGRGSALQLHRRRAEHVPDLERDAARRARRVRARVLPRLPNRPGVVHRQVLRQSRLDDRERLGLQLPDPPEVSYLAAVLGGYLAGSIPTGYWLVRIFRGIDIRRIGSHSIGATNVWRAMGWKLGVPGDPGRRRERARARARRVAARERHRRGARGLRRDRRARASRLPEVREGRQGGGDDGRDDDRARAARRARRAHRLGW